MGPRTEWGREGGKTMCTQLRLAVLATLDVFPVQCHKVELCFFFVVFISETGFSLCSPGCPGNHSVDQAGLELRNLSASASQVLVLKA